MAESPEHLQQGRDARDSRERPVTPGQAFLMGVILFALLLCLVAITGCAAKPVAPTVKLKTPLETAIEQIKDEWLLPCTTIPVSSTNTVGNLLDEAASSLLLAAECPARHNTLVDYLAPVVRKQKGRQP